MRTTWTVFRRELASYFYAPVAYVVGVVFLCAQGFSFWAIMRALSDPARPAEPGAVLHSFFGGHILHWMLCFAVVAVLSMKAVTEDRQRGLWEAALTTRATSGAIIIGKWLGAAVFYVLLWLPTALLLPVFLAYTPPGVGLELGPVVVAYLGSFAIGAMLLSFGVLLSSLTHSPVVAVVLSFAFCLLWFFLGELDDLAPELASGNTGSILGFLDLRARLEALSRGEVALDGLALLACSIAVALVGCHLWVGVGRISRSRLRHRLVRWAATWIFALSVCVLAQRHCSVVDVTEGKIHTLDVATEELLAELRDPIEIWTIRPATQEYDHVYDEVGRLIQRMMARQPLVEHKVLDPLTQGEALSSIARELALVPTDLADQGAIVLRRGDSVRSINLLDLATFSPDELGADALAELFAEASIAAAMAELIERPQSRVCLSQGHGELSRAHHEREDDWSEVAVRLEREAIRFVDHLLDDDLRRDCDALLVLGPSEAIPGHEALAVSRYLDAGGRLMLTARGGLGEWASPPTGLELVLAEHGIDLSRAIVLSPDDRLQAEAAWMTFEGYGEHPIVDGFQGKIGTVWQAPRWLRVRSPAQALVVAAGDALVFADPSVLEAQGTQVDEPPVIAAAASTRESGRVVVVGSAQSLSSSWFERGLGGNQRLLSSSVLWLLDRKISPRRIGKTPEHVRLLMSERALASTFVWCVIVLPALLAILGAILWWWRRREVVS